MSTPGWWETLLMAAAAYRLWRLAALDRILDRPRDALLDWLEDHDAPLDADYFVSCPWCLGMWISLGAWAAWLAAPSWAVGLSVPLALSAAVGMVAKLDPPQT